MEIELHFRGKVDNPTFHLITTNKRKNVQIVAMEMVM